MGICYRAAQKSQMKKQQEKLLLLVLFSLSIMLCCESAVVPPTISIDFPRNRTLENGNVTKIVQDNQGNSLFYHRNGDILKYSSDWLSFQNFTGILLSTQSYSFVDLQYWVLGDNATNQSDAESNGQISVSNLAILDSSGKNLTSFERSNLALIDTEVFFFSLLDYYQVPFETYIYVTIDAAGVSVYFGNHTVQVLSFTLQMATFISKRFSQNTTTGLISITANSLLSSGLDVYFYDLTINTDRNFTFMNTSATLKPKHTFAAVTTKIVVLSYVVIVQTALNELLAWDIYSGTPITLSPILNLANTTLLSSYFANREPFLLFDAFTVLLDLTTNRTFLTVLATFQGQWNFVLTNLYGYAILIGTAQVFNLNYCYGMSSYSLANHTCTSETCLVSNCTYCAYLDSCDTCEPGYSTFPINGTCIKNICLDSLCLLCLPKQGKCLNCTAGSSLLANGTCFIAPSAGYAPNSISNAQSCSYFSDSTYMSSCMALLESGTIASVTTLDHMFISIPSMNMLATFAAPLLEFNSDYWYYLYHNRNISNLYYTSIFFQFMTAINSGRMVPFFVSQDYVNSRYDQAITEYFPNNYSDYTNPKVLQLDQSGVYFLGTMRDMFIWNYPGAILMLGGFFLLLKIFTLSLHITPASPLKCKLATYLWNQSRPLSLFNTLIEANSIFITFYCSQQLNMMFAFSFSNKVSMVLCLVCLFGTIFSSVSFYVLVYALKRREAKLYVQDKRECRGSYFNETVVSSLRFCISGFLQGALLTQYQSLLGGLAALKAMVIISLLLYRKSYESLISWLLEVLYFFFGMGYDLFLFLTNIASSTSLTSFLQTNSIYFEGLLITGFIAAACAGLVVNFVRLIIEVGSFFKKYFRRSNRVRTKEAQDAELKWLRQKITEPQAFKRSKVISGKEMFKAYLKRRNELNQGRLI